MTVFVVNREGRPLMPTTPRKARLLLRDGKARIFCRKIEAELLAIDGYYRTSEEIDANLRGRPMQAWLDGDTMMITALN